MLKCFKMKANKPKVNKVKNKSAKIKIKMEYDKSLITRDEIIKKDEKKEQWKTITKWITMK
ncbi:hypothetical protein HYE28_00695 [Mycoplasmopsis bovis]|nr:hypothetical protein [Mycoplasmopsis bovis]QQH22948.1 hypothetical protein HYE28_00695 [Mycoplasmopsis bovis]